MTTNDLGPDRRCDMETKLLHPGADEWKDMLARTAHDVYHVPGYASAFADVEGGEARAFWASNGTSSLLVPLIRRPIPGHSVFRDAISPYGYPGPLLYHEGEDDPTGFLLAALSALPHVLIQQNVISFFMRCHPIMPIPTPLLEETGALVQHGETVYIDLRESEEELWRQTRSGHRNEINRAMRGGQEVVIDRDLARLDDFINIYNETMSRLSASDYYFFSRDFYMALNDALGDRLVLASVLLDGETIAAGLFTESCGTVQYFLSGAKSAYQKLQPTKLMLHQVKLWAKARGSHTFHLGGGVGGREDSLFRFKAGFSKHRAPFHTWRVVCDQRAYDELIREWRRTHQADADLDDGFFPLYRKAAMTI